MLKQRTGECIYIGPWVLNLAKRFQNWRNDIVKMIDSINQAIMLHIFLSKYLLCGKTRICHPQYSVSVTGNDLTRGDCLSDIGFNFLPFFRFIFTDTYLFLHLKNPVDHLLVGISMQRACQSKHTSSVGVIRITQRRTNEMCRMS